MTTTQKELLILLSEIDDICQQEGLFYCLYGETALLAYTNHALGSKASSVDICMTLHDALILRDVIEKQNLKDRIFDSLYNNDLFPNFDFYYCNTNTLRIDLDAHSGLNALGISVVIRILRERPHGIAGKLSTFLEKGWIFNHEDYPHKLELSGYKKAVQIASKSLIKLSRKCYAKALRAAFKHTQRSTSLQNKLCVEMLSGKRISFPSNFFLHTIRTDVDGHNFPIPVDIHKFFNLIFGKKWDLKAGSIQNKTERIILDPNLPFRAYLDALAQHGRSTHFADRSHAERLAKKRYQQFEAPVANAWKVVLCTGARYKMKEKYLPQKQHIIDLHAQQKWDELSEVLFDYDIAVRGNQKSKLCVFFDQEIFDAYIDLLCFKGEMRFADLLISRVPEEWKTT